MASPEPVSARHRDGAAPACVVRFRHARRNPGHDGDDASGLCLRGGRGMHAPAARGGCTLVIALRGTVDVEADDGVFHLGGRRFLARAGNVPRRILAGPGADWILVHAPSRWVQALTAPTDRRGLASPLLLPAALPMDRGMLHRVSALLRLAPHPCDGEAGRELAGLVLAAREAQTHAVDWVERAYGRSERHRRAVVARLLTARNRILNAPFDTHDLRALADAARYSPSHFLRSFREVFGMTPHDLLTHTRLLRACALIQDGKLAICEIAARVGYESRHAFSRSFKRATGITATRFRASHR